MSKQKYFFIVDAMLGKLAKKLRLFGYDSLYSSNMDDNKILLLAKNENRVLITKDVELYSKAKKYQILSILITTDDEIEQFIQINKIINFGRCRVDGSFSRCSICNGELKESKKESLFFKIPRRVLENNTKFWACNECRKIYWEGTHIKNLEKFTDELNDRLSLTL